MTSVYTSAFNVIKGQFNIESALKNFSLVGDEIVIATLQNEDGTLELLKSFQDLFPIKIVETDYTTKTFAVDGRLKEAALQNCSNEFCIQLDADERVGNPDVWHEFISNDESIRQSFGQTDALMLPVVNLYRDLNSYKDVSFKWYFHKREGLHRGVVNFARLPDGKFDKSKSDGCELIYADGSLVRAHKVSYHGMGFIEDYANAGAPFVVHFGHLDLFRRIELNKQFWEKTWESYDGKPANVLTNIVDAERNLYYTSLDFSSLL